MSLTLSQDHSQGLDDAGVWWAGRANKPSNGIEGRLRFALAAMPLGADIEIGESAAGLGIGAEGEVAVVLAAATNYRSWADISADPDAQVRVTLAAMKTRSPAEIVGRPLADHRQAFGGFDIDLGEDAMPETATSDRIRFS